MHMNQLSFSSIHWLNTSPCLSSLVLSTRWGSMPPMSRQTLPLKMGPLHSRETATSRMKLNSNFTDLIQVRMVAKSTLTSLLIQHWCTLTKNTDGCTKKVYATSIYWPVLVWFRTELYAGMLTWLCALKNDHSLHTVVFSIKVRCVYLIKLKG